MKPTTFSQLLISSFLLGSVGGSGIHVSGVITQCNGFGGDIKVTSASCDNCDWGEEATLSGSVSYSGSCDSITMVATAHAAMGVGGPFELLREDNFDCDSEFEATYRIPDAEHVPGIVQNVASGKVTVEFFDGDDRVGCSNIPLSAVSPAAQAAVGVAGIGALALIAFAAFKMFFARKVARSEKTGEEFGFSRMKDGALV